MKKLFITGLLSVLFISAFSQSKLYLRGDSIYIQRDGGNGELILLNSTRAVTGGVLTNIGNGRTSFVVPTPVSSDSTLQQVLDNSNLLTNPAESIENDPTNLTGSLGLYQGLGGATYGVAEVTYNKNRFASILADGTLSAGWYSTTDPLSIFGITTKYWSSGIGNQITASKYNYFVVDSNETRTKADTNRITGSRNRIIGQTRFGYPRVGTISTSDSYVATFSRNQDLADNIVGTIYVGPGSTTAPGNLVDFAIGTITTGSAFGIFTGNGNYQASADTNGGFVIGRPYAANFGHTFPPQDGLLVWGETHLDSTLRLIDPGISSDANDSLAVITPTGFVRKYAASIATLTGGGVANANAGSGYRLLKPASQNIKTLFNGYGITLDSTSNTDGITIIADTATLFPAVRATVGSGGGGSTSPAGGNRDIQFNNNGVFGAAASDSLEWFDGQLKATGGFRSASASGSTNGIQFYEGSNAVKVGHINWDATDGNRLNLIGSYGLVMSGNDMVDVYTASGNPIYLRPQGSTGVYIGNSTRVTPLNTLDIGGTLRIRTITSTTAADSILVQDAGIVKYIDGSNFSGIAYVSSGTTGTPTPVIAANAKINFYLLSGLATNPTFAAPTGSPAFGYVLKIRISDNGTARTLSWNAIYRESTAISLPTVTPGNAGDYLYLEFQWNELDSKWDLVGYTPFIQGFGWYILLALAFAAAATAAEKRAKVIQMNRKRKAA